MYASGRGSMKVRARWKIEDMARGQWQAVVTELPPGVSSQKVLEEIEELTNPKIKTGKKTLSPEQVALKQGSCRYSIRCVMNRAKMRLCVWCWNRNRKSGSGRVHANVARAYLAGKFGIDQSGDDRWRWSPTPERLLDIISEWIAFRFTTVTRRTQFRLKKSMTASIFSKVAKQFY
jgi:topoisomerase-4 subunit A